MRAFSPVAIRQLDENIRETVRKLIDSFVDRGHCDFNE